VIIVRPQPDLLAGLSVAALVVPQGMSYAKLAGLPSVYGLYGAFVPVLCYAALGSSRHLVSHPRQLVLAPPDPALPSLWPRWFPQACQWHAARSCSLHA
jgi:hypothetical protein